MGTTDKTALVTGASAGLGAEFTKLFAANGHDVVLVARRRDKLETLAREIEKQHGVRATVLAEDLTVAGAAERIEKALADRGIPIEFLVNNAGFATTGPFADADLGRELAMVTVNVTTLVHLTRLLLPAMIARKSGRILNIGSTAGFVPGPFMASYYASKAFVNSFTQALGYELRGTGVTATASCPGATATEFAAVAGTARSRLFQGAVMGAPEVAAHAYRAMMAGHPMAIPGIKNKLQIESLRLAPRSMTIAMAASLNQSSDGPEIPANSAR
jgi:short-subunit dehydrogenase